MAYRIIDRTAWKRREHFEHYLSAVPCTYSMTVKLDITNIRQKGLKLYPTMLYLLTKTVNCHEQFRMALNNENELLLYDAMNPCYTVFHKETGTFSNIWTAYSSDYETFCSRYEKDVTEYGNIEGFFAKPDMPSNCFNVSMVPWTTFEAFNLNIAAFSYLLPIFTMGKYFESSGRFYLPLAVQAHHAVCDGFHVCCFVNELQELVNEI